MLRGAPRRCSCFGHDPARMARMAKGLRRASVARHRGRVVTAASLASESLSDCFLWNCSAEKPNPGIPRPFRSTGGTPYPVTHRHVYRVFATHRHIYPVFAHAPAGPPPPRYSAPLYMGPGKIRTFKMSTHHDRRDAAVRGPRMCAAVQSPAHPPPAPVAAPVHAQLRGADRARVLTAGGVGAGVARRTTGAMAAGAYGPGAARGGGALGGEATPTCGLRRARAATADVGAGAVAADADDDGAVLSCATLRC